MIHIDQAFQAMAHLRHEKEEIVNGQIFDVRYNTYTHDEKFNYFSRTGEQEGITEVETNEELCIFQDAMDNDNHFLPYVDWQAATEILKRYEI